MHPVTVSKPNSRQSTRVRNVVYNDGKASGFFDARLQLPDWPRHVWRKNGFFLARIKASWNINADALQGSIRMCSKHFLNRAQNRSYHLLWIGRKFHRVKRNDVTPQVGHGQHGMGRMYIERKDSALT